MDTPAGLPHYLSQISGAVRNRGLPARPSRPATVHPAPSSLHLPGLQRACPPPLGQVWALSLHLYFLDYVGVAVYQYGSALAHFYYVIEQEWHAQVRSFFLPASAFLAWLSCMGCCYGKYASPGLPKFVHKLFQVVPSGLAYCLDISPVLHRIYKYYSSEQGCADQAVVYHCYQVVFFLISAYFFSYPHPERWFPGCCDFIGQGHQIFHVFLVLCTLVQIEAVRMDYSERSPLYESLHGDLAHDAVALFIFTACCSALTAFYVRKRVKAYLEEKQE